MSVIADYQQDRRDQLIEDFYFKVQQSEKYYARDYRSALKLQRAFKRYYALKKYNSLKAATIVIQRIYRGYKSRFRCKTLQFVQHENRLMHYYSDQAKVIQKYFRGFYCRKYVHDFYARQAYLNFIKVKNEEIRDQLNENFSKTQNEEEKRREEVARTEFKQLAKNLHHLTSTKNIPGIYNPPFLREKPAAFNVDVETQLATTFKETYKWRPPDKKSITAYKRKLEPLATK